MEGKRVTCRPLELFGEALFHFCYVLTMQGSALLLLVAMQCLGEGANAKRKKRRKVTRGPREEIAFAPPDVTEEEAGMGSGVPEDYSCAACAAVVFQLGAAFIAAEAAALPSTAPLSESAAIEAVEQACGRTSFSEYGLKGVGEGTRARLGVKKVLSGPGTLGAGIAGIVAGGGAWPKRLSALCWSIVESLEEGELTLRRDWERTAQQFKPSPRCNTCERHRATSQGAPAPTPKPFPKPRLAAVNKLKKNAGDVESASVPQADSRRIARTDIAFALRAVAQLSLALAELQLAARSTGALAHTELNNVREAWRNTTAAVGRQVLRISTFGERSEL